MQFVLLLILAFLLGSVGGAMAMIGYIVRNLPLLVLGVLVVLIGMSTGFWVPLLV